MDPKICIDWLRNYSTLKSGTFEGKCADMTARWITTEMLHGNGSTACNDPSIAGLLARARLATDCGWTDPNLSIFCDGSALSNGREGARAGYGVAVKRGAAVIHTFSDRIPNDEPQTNQRAELYALRYALNYATESGESSVKIYTDSKYAMDCLMTWGPGWAAANWKKADKKPVLHADLIIPMYELYTSNRDSVELIHVRAHTGLTDPLSLGNALVDELARSAAAGSAMLSH
jgi:ribonuclease HI